MPTRDVFTMMVSSRQQAAQRLGQVFVARPIGPSAERRFERQLGGWQAGLNKEPTELGPDAHVRSWDALGRNHPADKIGAE
jgi:hypothetical protein